MTILEVQTEEGDGAAQITLKGELDLSTVEQVETELERVEGDAPRIVVLDLRGLSFLDSTGLRLIVHADQRARQARRRLSIVKGPEVIQRVFSITGLDERLDIVDDPSEALTTS